MMKQNQFMELRIPAEADYALIVRMALSGFGMLAGLEVDLIDDLRTAADECLDCLMHQAFCLKEITVSAKLDGGRLLGKICSLRTDTPTPNPYQDHEMTKCILETLLPDVTLCCDETGVCCIDFSMPI